MQDYFYKDPKRPKRYQKKTKTRKSKILRQTQKITFEGRCCSEGVSRENDDLWILGHLFMRLSQALCTRRGYRLDLRYQNFLHTQDFSLDPRGPYFCQDMVCAQVRPSILANSLFDFWPRSCNHCPPVHLYYRSRSHLALEVMAVPHTRIPSFPPLRTAWLMIVNP